MEEKNNNSRISVLESQMETLNNSYQAFKKDVHQDIKEIKDVLLKRPSWSVAVVISVLTTISGSLIIYVVTSV